MEAREKAKQLKDYFYDSLVDSLELHHSEYELGAKGCAISAVDEIMKAVAFNDHTKKREFEETAMFSDYCFITYWQEVKEELKKL